ncbi:hypothetical protein C8J57DRAFT_1727511 [Mycena rebaudengoi]|nr:hypothetical protein C8J57DRAFT_1727511 [Mycena rebaudengoi]
MNLLLHAIPDSPAASYTRSRVRPPRRCVTAYSFIASPSPSTPCFGVVLILRLTLLLYASPPSSRAFMPLRPILQNPNTLLIHHHLFFFTPPAAARSVLYHPTAHE